MADRLHCSFCSKPDTEVAKLVAGPAAVFICDECVRAAVRIMDAAEPRPAPRLRRALRSLRRWLHGEGRAPLLRSAEATAPPR